jgi:hypothetical protein
MSQQPEDDVDDFDPMDVYTMEDFMEEDAILEEFRRELGEELKANIDAESSTVTCRHRRHSRPRRYMLLYELFVCYFPPFSFTCHKYFTVADLIDRFFF